MKKHIYASFATLALVGIFGLVEVSIFLTLGSLALFLIFAVKTQREMTNEKIVAVKPSPVQPAAEFKKAA